MVMVRVTAFCFGFVRNPRQPSGRLIEKHSHKKGNKGGGRSKLDSRIDD